MKTRMELWAEYREDIEKNISLQQSVMRSNKTLNLLYKRLLNVYPDYERKYVSKLKTNKAKIQKVEKIPKLEIESIDPLLHDIEQIEKLELVSNKAIDNLSFGIEELEEILRKIKKGKIKDIDYVETEWGDIKISKVQKITLGGKMSRIRIAIDGPSGSGKSTIARMLADEFKLKYINTGLIYRAVALFSIEKEINFADQQRIIDNLSSINISLMANEVTLLNGIDVTKKLRRDDVSQGASKVGAIDKVREFATEIAIHESKKPGVIMDGRDTTFNTMKDADLKIYLDTSPEVRAKRRQNQNKELGLSVDYELILSEILERDKRDKGREKDPLHVTSDAHVVDATNMSIEQVFESIKKLSNEVMEKKWKI